MADIYRIESNILPAIYPSYAYVDAMFTYNRPIRVGFSDEILKTSEKHKVSVGDPIEIERLVQSLTYRKYKIILIGTEDSEIDRLKYAESCLIILSNGTVHHADILDITVDVIVETQNVIYTITYKDKNVSNYQDEQQPVNNFLKSDTLLSRYAISSIYNIRILSSTTIDTEWTALSNLKNIYTKLYPKFGVSEVETIEIKSNGKNNIVQSNRFRTINLKCYLSEFDMSVVKKYITMADSLHIRVGVYLTSTTSPDYSNVDKCTCEFAIIESAVDLYECKFSIPYEQLIYNHYA